ncbi:hypothetical protein [Haloprofundus halobius]|uniref:hypothetical protein n=1 Tax=Haloprofundus halobius TaxID=2876194 RepID=UPI001CCDF6C4|nr:hypothetical protein [Haloprofundus halobius]
MDRRTFLGRTTVLAAVALAGCTSSGTDDGTNGDDGENGDDGTDADSGGADGTDGETETPGEDSDESAPRIADRAFERTGDCDRAGSATVSRDGDTVVVEGCIRGRNGCSEAVLDSAEYDPSDDRLSVVVATEEERDEDEACTQALVSRGYELRVVFEDGTPGTVDVVHDGADGQTTVTSSTATE